jgi:hypothetical protein
MDQKNNLTSIGSFIEIYRDYLNHGQGIMLCYISSTRKLEYVMFRQELGYKKFIFNEKLLALYNSLP